MAKEVFVKDGKQVLGSDFNSAVKGVDIDNRTVTLIASTSDPDRDSDIIVQSGWRLENYCKNPIMLWAHDYKSVPLARCVAINRTKDALILTHKFPPAGINPFADMILNLYNERVINAGSVGFLPLESEPIKNNDGNRLIGRRFLKQELLEHSGVAVPANPHAVQNAIKQISGSDETKDLLKKMLIEQSNLSSRFCEEEDVLAELEAIGAKEVEVIDTVRARSSHININHNKRRQGVVDMDKLLKLKMQILEKLAYAAEHGEPTAEIRQQLKEVDLEIQQQFPIPNPGGEGTTAKADQPNRLYFQDREGKQHPAITIKENLAGLDGTKDEDVRPGAIIRALVLGDRTGLSEAELRSMGENTGAAGGWILPTGVSNRIIDLARNKQVIMQAGAYTMEMPTPEMILVKATSDPTAYWRKESAAITESDGSIEPIKLRAQTLGVLVRVSQELLEDASNASAMIEDMISNALALELDRIGIFGSGAGEPIGIDVCSGINDVSMGTNGGTPDDYDEFSEACQAIEEANGTPSAVVMAPRTFYTLDRLKAATTNQPLQPPQSFQELRKFRTNQIGVADVQGTATNCSKAFVGGFDNLCYGIRKNIKIEASASGGGSAGSDAFARYEYLIRGVLRCDLSILRENHFSRIIGIKP